MNVVKNICSDFVWTWRDDSEYPYETRMQLDKDPNFLMVRNILYEKFPDFKWETRCNYTGASKRVYATFEGDYIGYDDYYGSNAFHIFCELSRVIDNVWHTKDNKKICADCYNLKIKFVRKNQELPNAVLKVKADYDGRFKDSFCYSDDGNRVFATTFDTQNVSTKNIKLENFVKAVCDYRSRLANKFVDEDKAARLKYANAQNEIDIETMEMKEELEAIAKKYFFELAVENRGETRVFILTLRYGNCIIVAANTQHAWVNIHTSDNTDGYALRYIRAKFGEMENKRFSLGDKTVIKIAEMLCNTYAIIAMAGTELVLSMNKFKNETLAKNP